MAFGQLSAPPPEERQCPQCGETMPAPMDLCLRKFTEQDAVAEQPQAAVQVGLAKKRKRSAAASASAVKSDSTIWVIFGLVAAVLFFALVAETPGLLIIFAIAAVPILIHRMMSSTTTETPLAAPEQMAAQVKKVPLPPANLASGLEVAFSAIGLAIALGVTFFVTFCATCVAVCIGGMTLAGIAGATESNSFGTVFMASIGLAIVAAIWASAALLRRMTARKG